MSQFSSRMDTKSESDAASELDAAGRGTQGAVGELGFSSGGILLHRLLLLLRLHLCGKLRHDSTSDLTLRLNDPTADAVSHELGREGSVTVSALARKVV